MRICDRCKGRRNVRHLNLLSELANPQDDGRWLPVTQPDLCERCFDDLRNWLRGVGMDEEAQP